MEAKHKTSQNGISKRWVGLWVCFVVIIAVLSFANELHRAQSAVHRYVGIWEDDIARTTLFDGDVSLQNKILTQLHEVHEAVVAAEVQSPADLQCFFRTEVPVTLNSLPTGKMAVCFGAGALAISAVTSPFFLFAILLWIVFFAWSSRREFTNRLQEQRLASELAMTQEIAAISRQVAHDIRGPLSALTTLSHLSHEMGAEKRDLFQHAVGRIQGIAEDLLTRSRQINVGTVPEKPLSRQGEDLVAVVESLLKEYRFANSRIRFGWHKHIQSSAVPVRLESIKLQRILGNLLNNSVEAAPESEASIDVTLMEREDHWLLQIIDNGCGIPEDVLPNLTREGFSFGKDNGNGLGLFDAKNTMLSIEGDLQIRSREGIGTQVILRFPKTSAAAAVAALMS